MLLSVNECYTKVMADPLKSDEPQESLQVFAEPGKLIPKLATKVGVAKAGNNYIISFVSDLTGEQAQMIDRIALPDALVDDLMGLINKLKEAENEK